MTSCYNVLSNVKIATSLLCLQILIQIVVQMTFSQVSTKTRINGSFISFLYHDVLNGTQHSSCCKLNLFEFPISKTF